MARSKKEYSDPPDFKRNEFRVRQYGFVGRIDSVLNDEIGFIRTRSIFRKDGGDIGFDPDDDIFLHINAFIDRPKRLVQGSWIAFFVGSSQKDGRISAEMCTPCDPPDFVRTR